MSKNEKPVHGGNRERAAETAALRGATFSNADFIIKTGDRQGLLALLLPGERNAIAARELAKITGRRPREITREIEALRLGGKPICASVKGYFCAENVAELSRYVKSFSRRLRHIQATKAALDDALSEATGQVSIWDGDEL